MYITGKHAPSALISVSYTKIKCFGYIMFTKSAFVTF